MSPPEASLAGWARSLRAAALPAPVLDAARGRVLEALGAQLAEPDAHDGLVDPLTATLVADGLARAGEGGALLAALTAAYAVAEQGREAARALLRGLLQGPLDAPGPCPADPLRPVQDWPFRPFGGPPAAHAAVEALMQLLRAGTLLPGQIEQIELTGQAPAPGLADSLAVAAIEGVAGLRPLRAATLAEPMVRLLAERVLVTPAGPPALLVVTRSGRRHAQPLGPAWGSRERPMSRLDLQDKFCAVCASRLSSARIDRLIQAVEGLGRRPGALEELRGLLAPVSA